MGKLSRKIDSLAEEKGFELSVPPRGRRFQNGTLRHSGLQAATRQGHSTPGGPAVRIPFAPPASQTLSVKPRAPYDRLRVEIGILVETDNVAALIIRRRLDNRDLADEKRRAGILCPKQFAGARAHP